MNKKTTVPRLSSAMAHTYRCSICGKTDNLGYYNPDSELVPDMRRHKLCYRCAFWQNLWKSRPKNTEVINGTMYQTVPFNENPHNYTGGKITGAAKYIYRLDRNFYRVSHICVIGDIPKQFQKYFPNTAVFCPPIIFYKLARNDSVCQARGCWDRYNCLRYDIRLEDNVPPFNTVPKNYKAGDERCPSFINKKLLSE